MNAKRKIGAFLVEIMVFGGLFLVIVTFIMVWSYGSVKVAKRHNNKISAMSIAEAGLNYYLWHLAHNNIDYCDGQTCSGEAPYDLGEKDYKDASGTVMGQYHLYITPPEAGSSSTEIKSVGRMSGSGYARTVVATIGMPSFTKYTLLVNNGELWVGSGEKIEGSIFVNNNGVHIDGEITGDASSTLSKYNSTMGLGSNLDGVNLGSAGVVRGNVNFPTTPVDFNQVSVDMKTIRDEKRAHDVSNYYGSSGVFGYHIIFDNSDSMKDKYTIKKVTNYQANSNKFDHLSILNETLVGTYNLPADGVIYCEDNVWIEGTVKGHQVTVFAADPDATRTSEKKRIILPNNLKYTNYDGTDKIGLITQTDILVARQAPTDLEIDAAMIAKEGEIKILDYGEIKNSIKVYGSMAHTTGLVWTYANSYTRVVSSGYRTTRTVVDPHNVLNPPPKFPLTGSYAILSWREE